MVEEVFEEEIEKRIMLTEEKWVILDHPSELSSEEHEMFEAHVEPLVDNVQEWIDSWSEEEKNTYLLLSLAPP